MGDEISNQPRTLGDYSQPSHEGYRNAIDLPEGGKVSPCDSTPSGWCKTNAHSTDLVRHHGLDLWLQVQIFYDHVNYATQMAIDYAADDRLRKLRLEVTWESIEDLAQYEEEKWNDPIFSENYDEGFTFLKRPYREELEGRILKLIDDREDQLRQLEEDMRKTKDTLMCLADSLSATLKVKIKAQRVHSTKIEKITRFPTHTPSVTLETLNPTMVHRVSMIFEIEPTICRTPHQHLNSNIKMPILHSFEENKIEYEDEDEVEIKMMTTGMDKELLEYNLPKMT
ncbi:hypothetical protein Tco_0840975 [Tanacetum coccineum]|uniref:MAK10-like protein n=1 Tax=Tanacetum coccineum TaxID=301880 RepID=A0ABQ5AYZ2_9ASTR